MPICLLVPRTLPPLHKQCTKTYYEIFSFNILYIEEYSWVAIQKSHAYAYKDSLDLNLKPPIQKITISDLHMSKQLLLLSDY